MRILEGHRGPVLSLAYASDGQTLASGGWDQTVRLWNPGTGREESVLPCGTGPVLGLAFSPTATWLAACGGRGLELWRQEGGPWRSFQALTQEAVNVLAFAPNNTLLAFDLEHPHEVNFFNLHDRTTLPQVVRHRSPFNALAFSADSRMLVGASGDPTRALQVLSLPLSRSASWHRVATPSAVHALAFAPDGPLFATGDKDKAVRLWRQVDDAWQGDELGRHNDRVLGVAFTPDGRTLVSASLDGVVKVWDVSGKAERACYDWEISTVRAVAFAPDGMTAAVGGFDGSVIIWDLE